LISGGNEIETAGRRKSGIDYEKAEQALFSNQKVLGTSKGSPGRTKPSGLGYQHLVRI
jgi:hypothetical protein